MAKLNAIQKQIIEAVSNYRNGSRGVVIAFESAIHAYWHTDSCNPENLQFMLNALKRFPVLQKAAKSLLPTFGKFSIKVNKAESDKTMIAYTVENDKKDGGLTKEQKVNYRKAVAAFIASEHTSLMHEKGVKAKVEKAFAFDGEKSAKAIRATLNKQLADMLKANPDTDANILRNLVMKAVEDVFAVGAVADVRAEARKAIKDKAAPVAEVAEAVAA